MDPVLELKNIHRSITKTPSYEPMMNYFMRVKNGVPEVLAAHFDRTTCDRWGMTALVAEIGNNPEKLSEAMGKVTWSGDAMFIMLYGIDVLLFTPDQIGEAVNRWNASIDILDQLLSQTRSKTGPEKE